VRIVLASSSPRRRELLHSIGIPFDVQPSAVEETQQAGEDVQTYVQRLAMEKARDVATANPSDWIIAADTVVYLDRNVLEKPKDDGDAVSMLRRIRGREHVVYTGLALHCQERSYRDVRIVATRVRMTAMSDDEVGWYVATGEPMDKAGAYAVQGIGALFIESIEGNYTNVVGLPLTTLLEMMKNAGIEKVIFPL